MAEGRSLTREGAVLGLKAGVVTSLFFLLGIALFAGVVLAPFGEPAAVTGFDTGFFGAALFLGALIGLAPALVTGVLLGAGLGRLFGALAPTTPVHGFSIALVAGFLPAILLPLLAALQLYIFGGGFGAGLGGFLQMNVEVVSMLLPVTAPFSITASIWLAHRLNKLRRGAGS